jgi:hypothetical protein
MKIRLVVSKFFLMDRQAEGLTVATNQGTACANFTNGLENFFIRT